MKKIVIILGLSLSLLANIYEATATASADTKVKACSKALQNAKIDAMEQAGSMVFSQTSASTSDLDGKISKSTQDQLSTTAIGVAKLKNKKENVTVSQDYQFTCKVNAEFEIDQDRMKKAYEKMIKSNKEKTDVAGYYEADGYSEEGQSRYKAFTSAKLVAQRNLLEQIQEAKISSLTKLNNGVLDDKMAKLLKGSIHGAKIVKREYDPNEKYAHIILRISKQEVEKYLDR